MAQLLPQTVERLPLINAVGDGSDKWAFSGVLSIVDAGANFIISEQTSTFGLNISTVLGTSEGGVQDVQGKVTLRDDTQLTSLAIGGVEIGEGSYSLTDSFSGIDFGDYFLLEGESSDKFHVIPEPSTYALTAGLLTLAVVAMRRRRL